MSGLRCDRILAGAVLALIFATPSGTMAQEGKEQAVQEAKVAAVPVAASPSEQPQAQSPMPDQAPANEAAGSSAEEISTSPDNAEPATQPVVKPDALASLDPADRAIAEKIRDLLGTGSDLIFASQQQRQDIEAFYQKRQFAPLWHDKGVENARKASVTARLKHADADGLEVSDYKLPSFAGGTADALAEAELKLTQTVLTYAAHLQAGRFPYSRVSRDDIELPQALPDAQHVLGKLAEAADAGASLEEFSPPHEPYRRLKAMLATMRDKSGAAGEELPEGPVLTYTRKQQMEDARVPQLRERLGLKGEGPDLRYDAKLSEAVKKFQRAHRLPATGNLDLRTVRELNAPTHDRQIETIIANMERWRWYARDLGEAHVLVNLPDFTLKVMHKGARVWTTRIVIGEPRKATPLLSETMNSITVNPVWHVPPSIVHNEYLPAQARDPGALSRMGLHVSHTGGEVQITMPSGGNNPLGRIRFNFFNRFMVYQHDTPDQYMFAHEVRAESHGCMRVQDPAKYAEVLFNIARPDEHWTAEKVKSMFGGAEQEIKILPTPIWVHLTYQTAFVDDDGKLQIRRDVYNVDSRTLAAIKGDRAVVEPSPERKHHQEVASTSAHRRAVARDPRGGARDPRGRGFFQSLFSAGPNYAKPPPSRRVFYR